MARVRYGARTEAEISAARASSSRLPDIWSTGVVAVWESDPDAVAAVLPPPLKPTERPLVRASISKVDLSGYPLGAGWWPSRRCTTDVRAGTPSSCR